MLTQQKQLFLIFLFPKTILEVNYAGSSSKKTRSSVFILLAGQHALLLFQEN